MLQQHKTYPGWERMEARQSELEKDVRTLQDALRTMAESHKDESKAILALTELFNVLDNRVKALEGQPRSGKPDGWTLKAMLAEVGQSGSIPVTGFLRFYAQQYCAKHNLGVPKTEGEKTIEYYPDAAAQYAMNKYREAAL